MIGSLRDSVRVILHDKDVRFMKMNRSFELDLFGESIERIYLNDSFTNLTESFPLFLEW